KGFKEFNLLSGERTDLLSTDRNSSNRNTLAQQRCDKQCPRAGPLLACLGTTKLSFYLYREIVHMNCLPLNYSTTSWAVSVNRYVLVGERNQSARRYQTMTVAFDQPNHAIVCLAQPRSTFCDSIKNGLDIRWRAGDDTQYFTRRSLLLQRLLEFVEQPHIFDGDDGLGSEGL